MAFPCSAQPPQALPLPFLAEVQYGHAKLRGLRLASLSSFPAPLRQACCHALPAPPSHPGMAPTPAQDCLLRRWMLCLSAMPAEPLTQLTSLMLLLLYEPEMKYDSAVHLMASYTPMLSCIAGISGPAGVAAAGAGGRYGSADGSNDQRHPLAVALDRITVQLFNFEEVTNRWAGSGHGGMRHEHRRNSNPI